MSQQSDLADGFYARLSTCPVAAAQLVRELRSRWGAGHGLGSVHGFVREVATCLLHHDDVEVGDVRGRPVRFLVVASVGCRRED